MKTECPIKEFKKELDKFSRKISNKNALFIIIGFVIALVGVIFLMQKVKNKMELLAEDDDFYYDEDDFYEDYHALDYEEENEE